MSDKSAAHLRGNHVAVGVGQEGQQQQAVDLEAVVDEAVEAVRLALADALLHHQVLPDRLQTIPRELLNVKKWRSQSLKFKWPSLCASYSAQYEERG